MQLDSMNFDYNSSYRLNFIRLSTWGEKEGDMTQSFYKNPIPTENSKSNGQYKHATENFDNTTIADRLKTVS